MTFFETITPLASLIIAAATVIFTTLMLHRQSRQMEHERNALAILEAIDRLTSAEIVRIFVQLKGVAERYPDDDAVRKLYQGSQDELAFYMVGQYVETIACLARRGIIDPSLIVDAVGLMLRDRWTIIKRFVYHLRRFYGNEYMFENFEWLARYSAWWKDIPRPPSVNYSSTQFLPSIDEAFSAG